jgi:hypothetical protein
MGGMDILNVVPDHDHGSRRLAIFEEPIFNLKVVLRGGNHGVASWHGPFVFARKIFYLKSIKTQEVFLFVQKPLLQICALFDTDPFDCVPGDPTFFW